MISMWLEIATRKMGEPTIATPIQALTEVVKLCFLKVIWNFV